MHQPAEENVPTFAAASKEGNDDVAHVEHFLTERDDTEPADNRTERSLKLKADLLIVPIMSLTFLVAYMDRNNLGNAKIMSFQTDTGINDAQFYNCLMLFYVGYLVMMLPSNLALRALGPNRTLGFGTAFFGVMVCGLSAARKHGVVMGLRVLIGMGEAMIQCGGLYLSLWYKRDELGSRASFYYSTSTISGAFSGLIAYGVQNDLDGNLGKRGWQWLFLLEGALAITIGLVIWMLLPPFPDKIEKHWLLNKEETALAVRRAAEYNTVGAKLKWSDVWAGLKELKCYLFAFIYGGVAMASAAVGNFLPTLVNAFGFDPITAQLFTVIPYACGTVTLVAVNLLSDYFKHKFLFVAGCLITACVGYILLMTTTSITVLVFATCLVISGIYPAIILTFSWANVNSCGYTKRATTWAVASGLAQCFSIVSAQVYTDPPRFLKGHGVILGFLGWSLINTVSVYIWMRRQNEKKDKIKEQYLERGEIHPHIQRTLEDEGDAHIEFRYCL